MDKSYEKSGIYVAISSDTGEKFHILILGQEDDIYYCAIRKSIYLEDCINFAPLHKSLLPEEPKYYGLGTINEEALVEQIQIYRDICEKSGFVRSYFTCSLSQLWNASRATGLDFVPMLIPANKEFYESTNLQQRPGGSTPSTSEQPENQLPQPI